MSKIDLLLGDCLELMKSIPDGSVDAIITDPPYGTTACKWDSVIDFTLMWEQLNRIIKPNGAIVLFGSEPFSSALRMSNIKNYKYDITWKKSRKFGVLHAKNMPLKQVENIIVFSLGSVAHRNNVNRMTYNPIMTKGKPYKKLVTKKQLSGTDHNLDRPSLSEMMIINEGTRYPVNIIEIPHGNNNNVHPTQKPVALMEYLIKTYTNENETVLDFTMGSGTTGVACKNLNRNFIGIELDKIYFEITKTRIEESGILSEQQEVINKFFN